MSDHRLGDVDGNMLTAIMDSNRVADHFRDNRGTAAPGLDDLFLTAFVERIDFLE